MTKVTNLNTFFMEAKLYSRAKVIHYSDLQHSAVTDDEWLMLFKSIQIRIITVHDVYVLYEYSTVHCIYVLYFACDN